MRKRTACRIVIIQGHPDPRPGHLGHALAQAYATGATRAGHDVKVIDVALLEFPLLRSKQDWETRDPPEPLRDAQRTISWADHLVICYPLWLGSMPALLKAFFEQVFRPEFAVAKPASGNLWKKLLVGKSARIVVTMGMPAFVYRWYFLAHSLRSLERNILRFSGIGPITTSLFGLVEANNDARRQKWLAKMHALGERAI
ncbi:MAG: NAD(P)H-dependent oxidoreductase [Betaproteobacteria bacterium]